MLMSRFSQFACSQRTKIDDSVVSAEHKPSPAVGVSGIAARTASGDAVHKPSSMMVAIPLGAGGKHAAPSSSPCAP